MNNESYIVCLKVSTPEILYFQPFGKYINPH